MKQILCEKKIKSKLNSENIAENSETQKIKK